MPGTTSPRLIFPRRARPCPAGFAITLILAVARRLSEGERLLRSGKWTGWKPTNLLGHRIRGKRLGIVGMGRIGQALATRARSFGLAIHYHNRRRLPTPIEMPLEATYWQSVDQMLARMDIVSINCPHTPQTFQLLSAQRLKLLPRRGEYQPFVPNLPKQIGGQFAINNRDRIA